MIFQRMLLQQPTTLLLFLNLVWGHFNTIEMSLIHIYFWKQICPINSGKMSFDAELPVQLWYHVFKIGLRSFKHDLNEFNNFENFIQSIHIDVIIRRITSATYILCDKIGLRSFKHVNFKLNEFHPINSSKMSSVAECLAQLRYHVPKLVRGHVHFNTILMIFQKN